MIYRENCISAFTMNEWYENFPLDLLSACFSSTPHLVFGSDNRISSPSSRIGRSPFLAGDFSIGIAQSSPCTQKKSADLSQNWPRPQQNPCWCDGSGQVASCMTSQCFHWQFSSMGDKISNIESKTMGTQQFGRTRKLAAWSREWVHSTEGPDPCWSCRPNTLMHSKQKFITWIYPQFCFSTPAWASSMLACTCSKQSKWFNQLFIPFFLFWLQ